MEFMPGTAITVPVIAHTIITHVPTAFIDRTTIGIAITHIAIIIPNAYIVDVVGKYLPLRIGVRASAKAEACPICTVDSRRSRFPVNVLFRRSPDAFHRD